METSLAKVFSVLFQPLLIPTYTLLILFNLNNYFSLLIPAQVRHLMLWMVFLITFVLPILFIFILYKRKMITSLNMDKREERIFPLVITALFYFLAYYIIYQANLDVLYLRLFLGSALLICIAIVVSAFWKISMHMIGVGGFLGALIGLGIVAYIDLTFFVILAVLVSGLTGFARLKLKAHTPMQVYAGFLTGLGVMIALFLV
jgi:membrane-associated phospholipid phosphatase